MYTYNIYTSPLRTMQRNIISEVLLVWTVDLMTDGCRCPSTHVCERLS